jgi:acyl-CoA synthetase (NDP forming)
MKKRKILTELESKEFLKKGGIPVVEGSLAKSKNEAIAISEELGLPVALKIISPDIVHKTDSGGVKLGLTSIEQVGNAYDMIMSSIKQHYPQSVLQGVSVQKMAPPGVEVIIGMSKDPQFGPLIMFGLGGILVELIKDISFRIAPVSEKDARAMIREIQGYPLLQGYRGQVAVDTECLVRIIVGVSQLAEQNPQIVELDINPVFASKDGAIAVDARIVLDLAD